MKAVSAGNVSSGAESLLDMNDLTDYIHTIANFGREENCFF